MRFPKQISWFATLLVSVQLWAAPSPKQTEFFEKNIRPVLAERCYKCHNSVGKAKGDLALDWRGGWMKGGESGAIINPGEPAKSLLISAIKHEDKDLKMPEDDAELSAGVIRNFEKWIAMGAPDPRTQKPTKEEIAKATSWETIREQRKKWWSFQPIQAPKPPKVKGNWAWEPTDQFIHTRLESNKLTPAPDAPAHILIRRLTFALTGLPPTPEETDSFIKAAASNRQQAIKEAVDRLLGSPHFGERWARHWMDWMRYAESLGSEGDPRIPHANQYRNYLIRALNVDVPYNQLLREHIAGDLLPRPRLNEKLGLNESAIGPAHYRFVLQGFAPTDALEEFTRTTENQIDVITKTFLGITVSCTRCHNHKFDAISQRDYYAFYGIMASCRPATINVDTPARQATHKAELTRLKAQIRNALATQWLKESGDISAQLLKPTAVWQKAINAAKQNGNPLHAWQRLQKAEGETFATTWKQLANDIARSTKALAEQQKRPYAQHWQFRRGDADHWIQNGNGLNGSTAKAGAFRVLPKGNSIVEDILPTGVYSHLLSDKHTGILGSPQFRIGPDESIWVRVRGTGNVMVRYVVQNYTRSGTVYPTTRLNDGKWRWQKWGLKYWEGDDAHLEVSTAGEQPTLASGTVNSWFGVTEAMVIKPGQAAPRDEAASQVAPLFELGKPTNREALIRQYSSALVNCIKAWQEDTMTDAQANFLSHFVRSGLLSNTLNTAPEAAALAKHYRKLEAEVPVPQRAPGLIEAEAKDRPLFIRGNHKQPGKPVARRFLEAFNAKPFQTKQSGRLELAEAMLARDNPLTARVIVNRVWHHLFGQGLVATPDNFGKLGKEPSHPELLDYLATRFVAEGWSLKKLIGELARTRTFQLSSLSTENARELDPGNQFFSHAHVRRLEAEAIRDAMLLISDSLNRAPVTGSEGGNSSHRSIYVSIIRNRLDSFLSIFDAPVPTSTQGRRNQTNVPEQSLALMNDPFVISLANGLAQRVRSDANLKTPEEQIGRMFQLALNREASPGEIERAKVFINGTTTQQQAARSKADALRKKTDRVLAEAVVIREPARKRLLVQRKKDEKKPKPAGPKPLAAWDFGKGTEDLVGNLNLNLQGTAKVKNGMLILDGRNGFARSTPLSQPLKAKTLEAWVQLNQLNQRGGGVISLQTRNGVTFDSIVFGEQEPGHWMAGSNNFKRTRSLNGPTEKEATQRPVHVAIVYAADGMITGYRNGKPYGQPYKVALQNYSAADSEVILGLRHGTSADSKRLLAGKILKARLYDRALEAGEVMASFGGNPNYISEKELLEALTETQRKDLKKLEAEGKTLNQQLNALKKLGATAPNPWRDLAQAMFNLKEFIYLQ